MKTSRAFFKNSPTVFLVTSLLPLVFTACLSVSLSPKITKSDNVQFSPPDRQFEKINSPGADQAWQDKKLGNSISFLSSCDDPADPTLENIERDMLGSLDNAKVLNTRDAFFDGRESRKSRAEGSIDGIQATIEVLTFKKNNCTYSISYVATKKNFETDLPVFNKFLESFKAP